MLIPNSKYKMDDQYWYFYIPRSATISELEKKLSRLVDVYVKSILKESFKMTGRCRIWKPDEFDE